MKKFLYIIIATLMASCGSSKPEIIQSRQVKDSVSVKTRIIPRDTMIVVPRDSVEIRVSWEDLGIEPIVATSESGDVKASISRVEDEIIVDCKTEELELKLQLLDKEIEKLKSTKTIVTETKVVPERYIPWWVKILAWADGIAIVAIALNAILNSFNPFKR